MNGRLLTLLVLLPALLLAPLPVLAQPYFQFATEDVKLKILSPEKFEADFGANPDIPRTDKEVLALARRLYRPLEVKAAEPPPVEPPKPLEFEPGAPSPQPPRPKCGTFEVGALFAALQNPAIADATSQQVDQIMAASKPTFTRTYRSTHFIIKYTDNDPDPKHNITAAQAKAVADALEAYYLKYTNSFTAPKANLPLLVQVFYIDENTPGQTSSNWNRIELNSSEVDMGMCPTPVLYFAVRHLEADGGDRGGQPQSSGIQRI